MLKIIDFHTNHLRNDAHYQFMTEVRDLIDGQTAAALKIGPQFAAFTALHEREDEALRKIPKSAFTKKIHEADGERDRTLSGMTEVNRGMCKHYSAAISDAALRVQVALDAYKNTASRAINEETSAVYNLVQELKSPTYSADVQTVTLAGWVNELERRNNAVESLVKSRFNEKADKTDIVLREARLAEDAAYKEICDIINARIVIEGEADYENFVKTLNVVIKKYAIKHPRHRRAETDGDEPDGDGPDGARRKSDRDTPGRSGCA